MKWVRSISSYSKFLLNLNEIIDKHRFSQIITVTGCVLSRTGSSLSPEFLHFISVSLHVSLSLLVWWHLLHFLLSSPSLWHPHQGENKLRRETVVCMQRESRNLTNMRAIQCNLSMIGRNVSDPSPHASYMMDGILLWRRETRREAGMRVRNASKVVRVRLVYPHASMHINVDTPQRVPTVFVFLLQQSDMLIWKGSAGIIDTGS